MSLQASIHLPGLISIGYPYQGMTITSHVRMAGNVIIPDKDDLPAGIQYLLDQLPPSEHPFVLPSHQLHGKRYAIKELTYYLDGNAVRQVNYVEDNIRIYRFNDDYIATFYGNEITEGEHVFTIVLTAFSKHNPGVTLFDSLDVKFTYSKDTNSIKGMLDTITPQSFMAAPDHQTFVYALDYVLTQRTEGALKNDIDQLQNLYDVELVPAHLLPFLAKTIGYDYFAGMLGNGDSIREELRFLPEWQKSVGTKESILVLLRALALSGTITPLYLDLQNKTLITGVKQRYAQSDSVNFLAKTKQARWSIPLTQKTFVTQSINCVITNDSNAVLAAFVWDIVLNKAVWQSFAAGWLKHNDGSDAVLADVDSVYADASRGGITITFDQPVKLVASINVATTYQYETESKPTRNTRLSEFFDVNLTSSEKPNSSKVKDYQHALDVIQRSKPFRTKIRNASFPAKSADAFVMNADSVSSTGNLSNPDRLSDANILVHETHLAGIKESVVVAHKGMLSDGFLFSWEIDCNQFENRFGIYHALAIDPAQHGEKFRKILARDGLVQRGHAILVGDDRLTEDDKPRWLRRVGFSMRNFTSEPVCSLAYDHLAHYHTIKHGMAVSPAVQTYSNLLLELDTPEISPSGPMAFFLDLLQSGGERDGIAYTWGGDSDMLLTDLATDVSTTVSFTYDSLNAKGISGSHGGVDYILSLFRLTSDSERETVYNARPNLRNVQLVLNKWYAVWDLTGDFHVTPVHLSILFTSILLNHQGTCCDCDLGSLTASTPATFSRILGKTYQFDHTFDLEVYSLATQEEYARYRWNSGSWSEIVGSSDLAVVLQPVNGGMLTDNFTVTGSVTYSGAPVAGIGQEWGVRACPVKVGDRMTVDLETSFTDDFGLAQVHGGRLGVIDESASYLGNPWEELIAHEHNQGGQRMAAFDGFYLRVGDLLPCFKYHVTMAAPAVVESVLTSEFLVHHFPKKSVFEFV